MNHRIMVFQLVISALFISVVMHQINLTELGRAFRSVALSWYLLALGAHLVTVGLCAGRWQVILRGWGIREGYCRLVRIYFAGFFAQLFIPASVGGDIYRAYALGRSRSDYPLAVGSVMVEKVVGFVDLIAVGFIPLLWWWRRLPHGDVYLVLEGAGLVAISIMLYLALVSSRREGDGRGPLAWMVARLPRAAADAWGRFRRVLATIHVDRRELGRLIALMIGVRLCWVGAWYLTGRAVGLSLPFLDYCILIPIIELFRMFPATFCGIGVSEWASILILAARSVPGSTAVALSMLILTFTLFRALIGWLCWIQPPGGVRSEGALS